MLVPQDMLDAFMVGTELPPRDPLKGNFISPFIYEQVRLAFNIYRRNSKKGLGRIFNEMIDLFGDEVESQIGTTSLHNFSTGKVATSALKVRLIFNYLRHVAPDTPIPLNTDEMLSHMGDMISRFVYEQDIEQIGKSLESGANALRDQMYIEFQIETDPFPDETEADSDQDLELFGYVYRGVIARIHTFGTLGRSPHLKYITVVIDLDEDYLKAEFRGMKFIEMARRSNPLELYRPELISALENTVSSGSCRMRAGTTGIACVLKRSRGLLTLSKKVNGQVSFGIFQLVETSQLHPNIVPDLLHGHYETELFQRKIAMDVDASFLEHKVFERPPTPQEMTERWEALSNWQSLQQTRCLRSDSMKVRYFVESPNDLVIS